MHEFERYWLDIVWVTSTHGLSSGTSPLKRTWTLSQAAVAMGERWQAGVGVLVSLWLAASKLGFHSVFSLPDFSVLRHN